MTSAKGGRPSGPEPLRTVPISFNLSLLELIDTEGRETGKSRAEIVREQMALRYRAEGYVPVKRLPMRFRNALDIFNILANVMQPDTSYDSRHPITLSYPNVLQIQFGKWHVSKQAVSIFSKICSEFKYPLLWQPRITHIMLSSGVRQKRYEAILLYFQSPITLERIMEMAEQAEDLMQEEDFTLRLIAHGDSELIMSQEDDARDYLLRKFRGAGGGEDEEEEGFDGTD